MQNNRNSKLLFTRLTTRVRLSIRSVNVIQFFLNGILHEESLKHNKLLYLSKYSHRFTGQTKLTTRNNFAQLSTAGVVFIEKLSVPRTV